MQERKAIRQYVAELLRTPVEGDYLTDAEHRIFASRTAPVTPRNMPLIIVYTRADDPDTDTSQMQPDGPIRRILSLDLEVAVAGDSMDDDADDICAQVERALMSDMNLGGLCESVMWTGTALEMAGEGADAILVAQMSFSIAYYAAIAPEEGTLPNEVLGSWYPDIGIPNEPEYEEITGTSFQVQPSGGEIE